MFCPQKVEKIGYHSRFNTDCNRERGYINSLYIQGLSTGFDIF